MRLARTLAVAAVVALVAGLAPALDPSPAAADESDTDCPVDPDDIEVPGAEYVQAVCLDDLTTKNNERTDTGGTSGAGTRENGSLHSDYTEHTDEEVPGLQIEGWFPDSWDRYAPETNDFMPACDTGMRHNSQFVIRVPNDWDGETLLVSGTPGIRTHFADDIIISDRALIRGWAYASQDKGNTGVNFFRAGDTETDGSLTDWVPVAAMEQWADLMGTTAEATQAVLADIHGSPPERTYASGVSNGGYQTRFALERHPELYDGGVDWEGHSMFPKGPNLFTYLPAAIRNYLAYEGGDDDAYDALVHEARMPPLSEPVWDYHYTVYWGLTQRIYRQAVDPEYTNYAPNVEPALTPVDPDAQYDYHERTEEFPEIVERMERIQNTGDTNGIPLITLHPDLDALLPIATASDPYAEKVRDHGHGDAFRYYVVEGATHVDPLADDHQDDMRPLYPCYLEALDALDAWVADGEHPPPSGLIPKPDVDYEELANECGLPQTVERAGGDDASAVSIEVSRRGFGIVETVVIAGADRPLDALIGGPLAATRGAPVLLVDDEVDDALSGELHRLGALEAIVVGDDESVSDDVIAELEDHGLEVTRLAGDDDASTAAAVAAEIGAPDGEAFVVPGPTPSAASASALAGAAQSPVLITDADAVPGATQDAIDGLGIDETVVVATDDDVSDEAVVDLPSPTRLGGADEAAVNAELFTFGIDRDHTIETVYVSADTEPVHAALAGPLAVAGQRGAPNEGLVLLVDGADLDASHTTREVLRTHAGAIEQALVIGDAEAVSDETAGAIDDTIAPDPAGACPPGHVPDHGFGDVDGNLHENAIACVAWHDVARGRSAGTYAPAGAVTRGQMASFVARAIERAGFELPTPSDQGFTDVAGDTHRDRINQLVEVGVVLGYEDDTYRPAEPVRRDQMASYLVGAVELVEDAALARESTAFTDIDGNPHEAAIEKVATADLAHGRTASTYDPASDVRRDQMASFLARALDRFAAGGRLSPPGP